MRMIIVAGLLATTAMVSIGLDQKIHSRLDRLGEAKGFFLDAVGKTKEDLGLKLGLAAHDTTIGQHLAWRLSHSVRSALESHITPGQLDQLTLWTAAGVESGRTRDTELFRPFEPGRAAQAMERYLWRNQNEVPELVLLRPLLGSTTSVYVAGSVILNDTWLRRFPKLKKAIESERLSISLQAHEEKTLATLNDNNMKEPVLLMSQRSDILTWRHSATIVTLLSLATWTALVLAILSAALAVRKPYLDLRRTHEETKSFMRWCASLNTTKDHSQDAKYTLADARRMIERLLAEKAHEKNLLEVKSRELTTKIEEQGTELERRQSLLIGISHYHSLAIQIIPMLEVFLSETANIRSMALTLETSLRERLLKGAHSLQATMHTWIQDIEIRGSRKFIRSLAETPGKLPDKTALDDDLATLAANGDFLYLVAQETILSLENLHGNTAHLVKIVEHWEAIKDKHSIKQQAESPLSPLLEAQEMVALTSKNDG
jgi:hypothetical protein